MRLKKNDTSLPTWNHQAEAVIFGHAVLERILLNRAETFMVTVSDVSVDR
jgi:hypothetical protein